MLFGLFCGFVFFLSESLAGVLAGNKFPLEFYVVIFPFYLLLGTTFAFFIWSSFKLFYMVSKKKLKSSALERIVIIITAFALIYFQVFIFINGSYIPGDNFKLSTRFLDLIWLIFCFIPPLVLFKKPNKNITHNEFKLWISVILYSSVLVITFIHTFLITKVEYSFFGAIIQILKISLLYSLFLLIFFKFTNILSNSIPKLNWNKINLKLRPLYIIGIFLTLFFFSYFSLRTKVTFDKDYSPTKSKSLSNKQNVILIVLDTVRADHLSCYGYEQPTTPNLDKFNVDDALKFNKSYSTSNWTLPGHASIFTGKYPISHGAHFPPAESNIDLNAFPLIDNELTLAEILRSHGYQTVGVSANTIFVNKEYGLNQGFNYWYSKSPFKYEPVVWTVLRNLHHCFQYIEAADPYFSANKINNIVYKWLNDEYKNQPFFMFINYMDAHIPYIPPSPYKYMFKGRKKIPLGVDIPGIEKGEKTISQPEKEHIRSLYDGEIAYLDHHLGMLFKRLKSMNLYKDSIIIVTSDHGEELGEHGLVDHGHHLYEPEIKIPILIKLNNNTEMDKNLIKKDRPVQNMDIFPTVLDLLNIEIPDNNQGVSLFSKKEHPIISECYGALNRDLTSIIKNNYKYIYSSNGDDKLFDLSNDKNEKNNIIHSYPEIASLERSEIFKWKKEIPKKILLENFRKLDSEMLKRLKTLGYIK